ncbi:tumor suppressor ARF isoform X2 [Cricetulus griseus]|uniref:Tumor suppressor ARF isoform X2 n=2 Tax=Cricetulus griseus TaxID=10029 RepID=A0A9J7FCD2_CRIGR|nr:tumor suppressor ARF isoform X2 [Cricetulus griseus]
MGRGRRFSPPVSHGGDRWASAAAGSMGYRFLVTVRIRRRRADRPPRVRAFVVQFPRSSRHRSASRARAVVALLLMLARSQRGPRLHPGAGHDDGQHPSSQTAAALRCRTELRGPSHPLPTRARCSAGGLLGNSEDTAPGGGAAGCA